MIIPCVGAGPVSSGLIRQTLRSVHPLRRWLNTMRPEAPVGLWYPWYFCPANVYMDTWIRSGIQASDLVMVDGVRPLRERTGHIPPVVEMQVEPREVVPLRLTPEQATAEARELLNVIILNRNKLLKSHEIHMKTPELRYIRLWVIPLQEHPPASWLVHDTVSGACYALGRRRELHALVAHNHPQTR